MLTLADLMILALAQISSFKQEPQYTEPLSAEALAAEAAFIASTLTTELRAPKELIAAVGEVLARVRKESPDVATLPVGVPWDPSSILLQLSPELAARLKEYKGDLAAFDFKDKAMNMLRDRIPIEKVNALDIGPTTLWTFTFREKHSGVNLDRLRTDLKRSPAVPGVMRNLSAGDGNELQVIRRDDRWLVAFKKGWGDCPAGCIYNAYWYFEVTKNKVELVERDHPRDHPAKERSQPRVYRWNFPSRLAVTVYKSLEDLVKTAREHGDWWHRAHALSSSAQLLHRPTSGVGEDDAAVYATLRKSALERREEILDLLIEAVGGKDAQLREAAEFSLQFLFQAELGQDPKAWTELRKSKK